MQSVFISSIQAGFETVRAAARRAVESLGMRPLMAELAGASELSPQRALLDLVAVADVFLLIVGPRYSKPTEDEFDEAQRRSKPTLVLRQNVPLDPDQEEFLDRVAGGWSGGRLWATFENEHDVGFAVVQALSGLGPLARQETLRPQAQTRAAELARGQPSGSFSSGSSARIAHVPLIDSPLLDALALDKPALGDEIADLARSHRLIPHSIGITSRVSRAGVSLQQTSSYTNDLGTILVGADGAVVCSGNVGGDDQFSGMRVDPTRLQEAITQAGQFALAVWERIDTRQDVQRVAVAVAIPEAQNKVFGHSTGRNSISMGGSGPLQEVVVPDPPAIVRRSEIGSSDLTLRLVAEVRRAFADAGAVEA